MLRNALRLLTPYGVRLTALPRLVQIWGSAADNIYAVGDDGAIVHFDGIGWTSRPTSPTEPDFQDVHGTGDDAVAVATDGSIWRINPR